MELQPLLFMSSCFLTLSGLTFGDQSGTSVTVREGDDAILPCSFGTSIDHVRFEWKKDGTEKEVYIHDTGEGYSPALRGRVSHFPDDLKNGNASIRIYKVQLEDRGNYTCNFPTRGKAFRIELVVGTSVIVREGDDAILPCSLGTNENTEHVRFEWTKEGTKNEVYIHDTGVDRSPALPGRVSHFPDGLKHGNASIRINYVQLKDGGIYTCNFPSRRKTFRIELVVDSVLKIRNDPGAAEPHVTSHDQINGGALLQCDVQSGLHEPRVEWWDSNNQIIPPEELQVSVQGGRFYITLKATVEKSGRYHCVATQEKIYHQAQKEINVHIYVPEPNTGLIVAVAGLAVVLAVVVGILVRCYFKNKKKSNKKESSEPSAQEQKLNADQSV